MILLDAFSIIGHICL